MAQIATRPTSPIACATRFMKSRSARIHAGVLALSRARVTQCDSVCFSPKTGSSTTAFNSRLTAPRGSGVDSMRAGRDASAATQVSAGSDRKDHHDRGQRRRRGDRRAHAGMTLRHAAKLDFEIPSLELAAPVEVEAEAGADEVGLDHGVGDERDDVRSRAAARAHRCSA